MSRILPHTPVGDPSTAHRRPLRRGLRVATPAVVLAVLITPWAAASPRPRVCVVGACVNAHRPIYFVSGQLPNVTHERVYRMNDDGSEVTAMTGDISSDNSLPVISVDRGRSKLAILGHWSADSDIITLGNIDGTGQQVVARGLFSGISLSPDGATIAASIDHAVEILTPRGPHVLTTNPGRIGTVAWSPDGRRIAFDVGGTSGRSIWVVDADGTNPMQLTAGRSPTWSPDGSRVAYAVDDPAAELRWVTVTPHPAPHVVDLFLAPVTAPTWSPDGAWLAYDYRPPGRPDQIRKIRLDGTGDTPLVGFGVSFGATWGYPAVSPIGPVNPRPPARR